ncbi:hypothetical protein B484DRAFT_450451 [Ochromonadaceae sp. CCMP2298]|nr:hypothetical protein B484DRAFT_450451 [Ochromonadaceae sp. CCMP2298]
MRTFESCWSYVTTTTPFSSIQQDMYEMVRRLVLSAVEMLYSSFHVVLYLSLIVAKLFIAAFPHAVKVGKAVYVFHSTQLRTSDLVLEAVTISLIVLGFLFHKKIQRLWTRFIASVSAKSKKAAAAAPHVLFFGTALTFSILGRKFLLPLTSPTIMPLFTLVLPLITTYRAVRWARSPAATESSIVVVAGAPSTPLATRSPGVGAGAGAGVEEDEGAETLVQVVHDKLQLWVILAMYHALATGLSWVPFSQRALEYLPAAKEMTMVVLVWIQLSPTFSDIVFDSFTFRILVRLCNMIPAGYSLSASPEQTGYLFSSLKMMRLISDAQVEFLQSLLQDSVATLLAVCFIFTPTFIASFGMVTVALLLPAFRTAAEVGSFVKSADGSTVAGPRSRKGFESPSERVASAVKARAAKGAKAIPKVPSGLFSPLSALFSSPKAEAKSTEVDWHGEYQAHWLRYWICLAVLWLQRIYWVRLWPSTMILLTLYLQHSYFRGATRVTQWFYDTLCVMVDRNHRVRKQSEAEGNAIIDSGSDTKAKAGVAAADAVQGAEAAEAAEAAVVKAAVAAGAAAVARAAAAAAAVSPTAVAREQQQRKQHK